MKNGTVYRLTEEFQGCCEKLPPDFRKRVPQKLELLGQNQRHRSLCLKKVGSFWAIKISRGYRALAVKEGEIFVWVWTGDHDEYMQRIR